MDEYSQLLSSFRELVTKHNWLRKAAYPIVSYLLTDGNPRSTKFGGKYPLLPGESVPKCPSCDQTMMMIVQLFVPSLPEFVQTQFPSQSRDGLLVLGVCPECLGSSGHSIRVYSGAELDSLVYHDDVGEQWSQPEFQYRRRFPRIPNSPPEFDEVDRRRQFMRFCLVGGWTETEMVPYASSTVVKQRLQEEHQQLSQRTFIAAHDMNMKSGLGATCYIGGWPRFCSDDQSPGENFVLLFSLCESEAASLEWGDAGTAQIWMGINDRAGEFRFTCSSY
jgi:hypothetical protein